MSQNTKQGGHDEVVRALRGEEPSGADAAGAAESQRQEVAGCIGAWALGPGVEVWSFACTHVDPTRLLTASRRCQATHPARADFGFATWA